MNSCPRVLIDGPYGAPAQEYKNYEVVLLVGLGIGATPMISIMKDIVNNNRAVEEEEMKALEKGSKTSAEAEGASVNEFHTRRAYFYWVTREQGSFDWFKGEMNEVAELDNRGVIELHTYCTCVYQEGDARSALITMLQSLNHAKNGVDIVSGTRVKSHFAKPDWRTVYERIARNHTHSRVGQSQSCPDTTLIDFTIFFRVASFSLIRIPLLFSFRALIFTLYQKRFLSFPCIKLIFDGYL